MVRQTAETQFTGTGVTGNPNRLTRLETSWNSRLCVNHEGSNSPSKEMLSQGVPS